METKCMEVTQKQRQKKNKEIYPYRYSRAADLDSISVTHYFLQIFKKMFLYGKKSGSYPVKKKD